MLKQYFILCLCALLASCTGAYEPTPENVSAVQVLADADSSQETAVSAMATANYFASQLTATIEAKNGQATERAWSAKGTVEAGYITTTARAWEATATSASVQATSSAASTATAQSIQSTATQHAVNITGTADFAAAQAYATRQFALAKEAELAVQRAELTNRTRAILPFLLTFCFAILTMATIWNWTRIRVIHRDESGDAPLLLNVVEGIAYDADRHPNATAGLRKNDLKQLPPVTSNIQSQVTARDQLMDMLARGMSTTEIMRQAALKQIEAINSRPLESGTELEILNPHDARAMISDVIPIIITDAIDAEIVVDPNEGDAL